MSKDTRIIWFLSPSGGDEYDIIVYQDGSSHIARRPKRGDVKVCIIGHNVTEGRKTSSQFSDAQLKEAVSICGLICFDRGLNALSSDVITTISEIEFPKPTDLGIYSIPGKKWIGSPMAALQIRMLINKSLRKAERARKKSTTIKKGLEWLGIKRAKTIWFSFVFFFLPLAPMV